MQLSNSLITHRHTTDRGLVIMMIQRPEVDTIQRPEVEQQQNPSHGHISTFLMEQHLPAAVWLWIWFEWQVRRLAGPSLKLQWQ